MSYDDTVVPEGTEVVCGSYFPLDPSGPNNHPECTDPRLINLNGVLFYKEGDSQNDPLELRGGGEYFELVMSNIQFDSTSNDYVTYCGIFSTLKSNGINCIRTWAIPWRVADDTHPAVMRMICPFIYKESEEKYFLHLYNMAYFQRLREMIRAAQDNDVVVCLSLFDFCSDIQPYNTPVPEKPDQFSPWHARSNDYGSVTENNYDTGGADGSCGFYQIWQNQDVNELGKLQRDYIYKIVYETRDYWNVIYEIANEPKCTADAGAVGVWHLLVSEWIKYLAPNHLVSAVAGRDLELRQPGNNPTPDAPTYTPEPTPTPYPTANFQIPTPSLWTNGITTAPITYNMMINPYIDIISVHAAFNGWYYHDCPSSCPDREDVNIDANPMARMLRDYTWTPPEAPNQMPKIRWVDGDGLMRQQEQQAWARDFDQNCR